MTTFNFDEPDTLRLPTLPWCEPAEIELRLQMLRGDVKESSRLLNDNDRALRALRAFGLPLDLPPTTHGMTTIGVQIAEE